MQPRAQRPAILPLTSFRFFAAMLVVIFHYDVPHHAFPFGISGFGYEAVTFFFILSGFVLAYAHGKEYGLNIITKEFYIGRAARIVPAYWIALAVALPFAIHSTPLISAALVITLLQSWWPIAALAWNGPAWSLSNEAAFYIAFPMLWRLSCKLGGLLSMAAAYALIVISTAVACALPNGEWQHNLASYFPLITLPQFMLGVALARWRLEAPPRRQTNLPFYLSLVALAATIVSKQILPLGASSPVLALIFATIIYAAPQISGYGRAVTSWSPFVVLGEASYAMYILHVPLWLWWDHIIRVTLTLTLKVPLDFCAYLIFVLGCSLLLTRFVEPSLRRAMRSAISGPPWRGRQARCCSTPDQGRT